jgi:uncharacterized protein (TIGR03435 family)
VEVEVELRRGLFVGAALIACLELNLSGALMQAQIATDTVPEWQKAAGGKMVFEVASIKTADPEKFTPPTFPLNSDDFFGVTNPHGRFVAQFPVSAYIGFAYKLRPSREQSAVYARLPKWVSTDQYAINAQAEGSPTKDQMRLMMQSLLADRFKLTVHLERQEAQVIALVLDKPGKTGAKLYPHSDGPPCDVSDLPSDFFPATCDQVWAIDKPNSQILMGGRNMTMDQIAANFSPLSAYFAQSVVNQTGLEGRFDFTIQWTRESNNTALPDPLATTLREAMQDQLGLKLKSTKASIDILVVDHIERPTEN